MSKVDHEKIENMTISQLHKRLNELEKSIPKLKQEVANFELHIYQYTAMKNERLAELQKLVSEEQWLLVHRSGQLLRGED